MNRNRNRKYKAKRIVPVAASVLLSTSLLSSSIYADALILPDDSSLIEDITISEDVTLSEDALVSEDIILNDQSSSVSDSIDAEIIDENIIESDEISDEVSQLAVLDNISPTMTNFTMDKTSVKPGEYITFRIKITDESGIQNYPSLGIASPSDVISTYTVKLYPVGDDYYEGKYAFSKKDLAGQWMVRWIHCSDIYGNEKQISVHKYFTLKEAEPDTKGPVVKSFSMDKKKVKPGDCITFTAEITDDSTIKSYPDVGISFPNDPITSKSVYLYKQADGSYKGTYVIPSQAVNGRYDIRWVSAEDVHGNLTVNSRSEYYIVEGGITDNKSPVISNFKMDKTKVHSGDTITFTVTITDESGIKGRPDLGISKPNYSLSDKIIYLNKQSDDTYVGTYKIPKNAVVGNYRITWISCEDIYGNYAQYSFSNKNVYYTVLPDEEHIHVPIVDPGEEPTCTEPGRTDIIFCKTCDEILEDAIFYPAKGHSDQDEDGYCDVCGAKVKRPEVPVEPDEPEQPPVVEPGDPENPSNPENPNEPGKDDPATNPEGKPDSRPEDKPAENPAENPTENPVVKPGDSSSTGSNTSVTTTTNTVDKSDANKKDSDKAVDTGDSSHRSLWTGILLVDTLLAVALLLFRRKFNK